MGGVAERARAEKQQRTYTGSPHPRGIARWAVGDRSPLLPAVGAAWCRL